MAVRDRIPGFLPGAVRLAREMRAGSAPLARIEAEGPPGPFGRDADVRRYLEPYSNTVGYVPRPGSKALARLAWTVRRVWKKVLAPWLSMQTHFNEATIAVVEQLMTALRREQARRLHLEERVRDLEEARVCDGQFPEPATPTVSEEPSDPAAITEQCIENMFLHTRLPAPPGRLLALVGDGSASDLKLSSLGFEVIQMDVRTLTAAILPFEEGSFDVAVSLSTIAAEGPARSDEIWSPEETIFQEIGRVLRPGSRFLWTMPVTSLTNPQVPRPAGGPPRNLPAARFRIRERVCAFRAGDQWHFTPDEETEGTAQLGAVRLVSAEKV